VWVVVDGSTDGSREWLEAHAARNDGLRVLVLPENRGKGAAIRHGLRAAADAGFTHTLTFDSDGQHPAEYIDTYMRLSRQSPDCMILGEPVFGPEAPVERVHARRLANFWSNLETLWAGLGDSLFGMRVYPIVPALRILDRVRSARGFDFEPEIAVRLWWAGHDAIVVPTPVRYLTRDEGGVSHFRYWSDTARIVAMHHRLVLLRWLWTLPVVIARRCASQCRRVTAAPAPPAGPADTLAAAPAAGRSE
jgi:hypothetical protein